MAGKRKKEVQVPKYTRGEERMNSITHGVGAVLAAVALIMAVVISAKNGNALAVVCSAIYGVTMIIMFSASCVYHGLGPETKAKKVMRVVDHCDIFVFIAGTYTPYCLVLIGGRAGWTLFAVVWLCAIVGAVMNAVDLEKFQGPSTAMYLIMGWMIILSYKSLKAVLHPVGLWLLIGGGVAYSVGALLYVIGAKKKYFHSVFHFFVLLGSILQFFSIYFYVLS